MWKFLFWCYWKQIDLPVATNRVSVLYSCGTGPATGQRPRQMEGSQRNLPTPPPTHPPKTKCAPEFSLWRGQMLCIQDIGMERLNLDRKRKINYHILIISHCILTYTVTKCLAIGVSASHYLESLQSHHLFQPGGVDAWREWLESITIIYHKHAHMEPVIC